MMTSLFDALQKEGLNRFQIRYDWRSDEVVLYAAREWDAGTRFADYNAKFTVGGLHPKTGRWLDHSETEAIFGRHGVAEHLAAILELMRKGRHMLLDGYYHEGLDIRFVNHIHSDRRGLNNCRSSLVMGGIRRHEPGEPEIDVFIDGLNLGRGMTFKNVAAGLPMGGCKTTVQMAPVDLDDLEQVGFLAYATDRTRNTAGPDMGFPPELADVVREHFSLHFVGGPGGSLGPTGTPTAHGVHMAVRQGARFLWGSESLAGKRIAVQGLGAVGFHLAHAYLEDGAHVIVSDTNPELVRAFAAAHTSESIEVIDPGGILDVDADILSPAAVGGILTAENIPGLKFKLIMGGANNVLRASSQEEEIELARLLAANGVLYQIDWWHNVAGVMAGYEEYTEGDDADMGRLLEKVGELCSASTRRNLEEAKAAGITPTENAYRTVEREVYGEEMP
jgi:leucine dehydrogenase